MSALGFCFVFIILITEAASLQCSQTEDLRMSSPVEDLLSRLQQLQCHFTWGLRKEDLEVGDFSMQQQQQGEDLSLGQQGALVHSCGFLAYMRYLQGQPEEAESLLSQSEEKIRERYGEESELHLIVTYGDLAWLKYHRGDHTQSQTYCQRVQDTLVRYPVDCASDLHPEVYGEKGWSYLKLSKSYYQKAMDCFSRALELQPDSCDWNTGYAVVLYRTEEEITQTHTEESPATQQLRQALEISPDDGVLLCLLALKLVYYQKHQEGEGLVERALKAEPENPQVIRYVAKYLRKQGELDQSIDMLQRALKDTCDRKSAFIHHQLALCYKRKKVNLLPLNPCPEEEVQHWRRLCIQHLEEALRWKRNLNHAKANLALGYAEENHKGRAHQMFSEVLEQAEEEPDGMRQFIYRCYAEFCHYHIIQKDQAIAYYIKGLQISTTTSEGRHCLKKVRLIAERRLRNNPRDATAYGILGAAAEAEGEWRTAAGYYEKALERDESSEEYLSALSKLRLRLSIDTAHV